MRDFVATSPEKRQHICLSQYAEDIICSDSLTFYGSINMSGFINTIIRNSKEEVYTEDAPQYPKDSTRKIRLQNDNYDYLYEDNEDWRNSNPNISQSTYIKYIMESYAHKTLYERENTYYADLIDHINSNLDKGLTITVKGDDIKYDVKPYRFSYDYESAYHYLIGLSRIHNGEDKTYRPASIRLSRIDKCQPRKTDPSNLTQTDINRLDIAIKVKGVEYLIGEREKFRIQLTPAGLNMYNNIFHMRPVYTSKQTDAAGNTTMEFNATERQIYNYFFRFGKEAIILEPTRLADRFISGYQDALNAYNTLKNK